MFKEKLNTLIVGVAQGKIRSHFSTNQKFYIGVAVGAAGALIVVKRGQTVNVITVVGRD